jgi:hypothetical protein
MSQKTELIRLVAKHLGVPRSRFEHLEMRTLREVAATLVTLAPPESLSEQEVRDDQQRLLKRLVLATRAHAKLDATATAKESITAALGADTFEAFERLFAHFGTNGIGDLRIDKQPA